MHVLIEEAWRLYLLIHHRAVLYQRKPKCVLAIEGSKMQRRISGGSGLARHSARLVTERAAVRLHAMWDKIYQRWAVFSRATGITSN